MSAYHGPHWDDLPKEEQDRRKAETARLAALPQWERVNSDSGTQRLRVEGGWLYRQTDTYGVALEFVKDLA